MDYWGEAIALTIDGLVFGICCKLYFKCQKDISSIQKASALGINPPLQSVLFHEPKKYVVVQGDVKAIGKPIRSINYPDVTGVVQRLSIKEHAIARNASGFWADQKHTIQEAHNIVPFLLVRGNYKVQIFDPLNADVLDLDTIADRFEPSSLGFTDHLVGFFSGVRQRGLQTTEELLKEGTVITGIGDITMSPDGVAQLVQPVDGKPFILTAMPISSLLRRVEDTLSTYRKLTIFFGIAGIVLSGLVVRRWYKFRIRKRQEKEAKQKLEDLRKERRQTSRDRDIPEDQRCVVCRSNPKEMIILPCGHVCLCEDCSDNIHNDCPVCRGPIERKCVAFIS